MYEWLAALLLSVVPGAMISTAVGIMFKRFEKRIDKRDEARSKRDFLLCKGTIAAIELGTTQAKELQEKGHINGNTQQAYDYAMEVKHNIEDFYARAGSQSLNK